MAKPIQISRNPKLNYSIDKERVVESKKFIEIIEARTEEIVENAWFQVPLEYADKLLGGIVLTGGGSNMPEIDKVFKKHTNISKIRFAKFVTQTVKTKDSKINNHDGTMNTILGILAKGDMNCAGEEINNDLFNNAERTTTTDSSYRAQRNPNETAGTGVVPTPEDKKLREEELRKKKEEEERLARIAEEEEREREEKKKRENSFFHKGFRKIKDFFIDTISEEE